MRLIKEDVSREELKVFNKQITALPVYEILWQEYQAGKLYRHISVSSSSLLESTVNNCKAMGITDTDAIINIIIANLLLVISLTKFVEKYHNKEIVPGWKLEEVFCNEDDKYIEAHYSKTSSIYSSFMTMSFANSSTEIEFNIYLMSGLKPDMQAADLKNRRITITETIRNSSANSQPVSRNVTISLSGLKDFIVDELKK